MAMMIRANEAGRLGIKAKTFKAMGFNDGAGVSNPLVCQRLADELAAMLAAQPQGEFSIDLGCYVEEDGRLLSADEIPTDRKVLSAHRVRRERVEEFIVFLRECGGFEVW